MCDPLLYTSAGKSYSHLPMRSNGLPYPVEQKVIDISANPGWWLFHDRYIEAIGAVTWLGEHFWRLTGANREEVQNTPWVNMSPSGSSAVKLQVAPGCFVAAEGSSGELQKRLRSLLFRNKPLS